MNAIHNTIRRLLQYSGVSARQPLLRSSLTLNYSCLRLQCCPEPWRRTLEYVTLCFETNHASACIIRRSDQSLETPCKEAAQLISYIFLLIFTLCDSVGCYQFPFSHLTHTRYQYVCQSRSIVHRSYLVDDGKNAQLSALQEDVLDEFRLYAC